MRLADKALAKAGQAKLFAGEYGRSPAGTMEKHIQLTYLLPTHRVIVRLSVLSWHREPFAADCKPLTGEECGGEPEQRRLQGACGQPEQRLEHCRPPYVLDSRARSGGARVLEEEVVRGDVVPVVPVSDPTDGVQRAAVRL